MSSSNNIVKASDSFGSRNSLNEAIPTGNVAAYRKSLENKYSESNLPISMRKSPSDIKSELRKSLDNLDDRSKATPPPVLLKKPAIPIKKSPTVSSVAGNIFSGLKQKVEQKVKTIDSKISPHDNLDGMGSSKLISGVVDNSEKSVIGERISRDESEFDQIGRNSSILSDVRQQRAKAPKRRLPSSNSGSLGDNGSYQNGDSAPATANNNSASSSSSTPINKSEEDLTKPKPREWEKNRAPWMEELKASQAKKTSPSIDGVRSTETMEISSTENSHSVRENLMDVRSSSIDIKSTNDSAFRSNSFKSERSNSEQHTVHKSSTKISISDSTAPSNDDVKHINSSIAIKNRPNSVQLRSINLPPPHSKPIYDSSNVMQTSTATITKAVTIQDDSPNHSTGSGPIHLTTVSSDNICAKFAELELRVQSLEKLVQKQNVIIEDLQKHMKDESDKVKTLTRELDKYAQCVTQV